MRTDERYVPKPKNKYITNRPAGQPTDQALTWCSIELLLCKTSLCKRTSKRWKEKMKLTDEQMSDHARQRAIATSTLEAEEKHNAQANVACFDICNCAMCNGALCNMQWRIVRYAIVHCAICNCALSYLWRGSRLTFPPFVSLSRL